MMQTRLEPAATALTSAVEYLRAGELVAFPTETVYGLGADARRDSAVRKIYEAKGRPTTNPSIVHAADLAMARTCAKVFPHDAERLAARFWPGPLTLILERGDAISPAVSGGLSTVAIRVPRHPVAEALLKTFNAPIAAPSANRSGFVSPTSAGHVLAELGGRVPLILDGGPCEIGLESTVLDLTRQPAMILRPGGVTAEMLRTVLNDVQLYTGSIKAGESSPSPGMLDRHYAPRTRAFRFSSQEWESVRARLRPGSRVALISWIESVRLPAPHTTILLPADDGPYARSMYLALRQADESKPGAILVLMPEKKAGLWTAVIDRLMRATTPLDHKSFGTT